MQEKLAKLATQLNGKGGGRADLAMAGGKDTAKLSLVKEKVPELISSI